MHNTYHYHLMVHALRQFFHEKKGFIEVPAQSRTSILAACEDPLTISQYQIGGVVYPLPQTGQMWLEYELLKNPSWNGVYCITTSYRDEPNPIPGRHLRIFPMFEFEAPGDFEDMKKLEYELVTFLGFDEPISLDYIATAARYDTQVIEAVHETSLAEEVGSCLSLEKFPGYTNPFWNMKYVGSDLYSKIDLLLFGMETIGSAERESDVNHMREQFFTIKEGQYCAALFKKFTKERVMAELDDYLALPMIKRFGGGIGLTRLERAMELANLFAKKPSKPRYMAASTPQLTL